MSYLWVITVVILLATLGVTEKHDLEPATNHGLDHAHNGESHRFDHAHNVTSPAHKHQSMHPDHTGNDESQFRSHPHSNVSQTDSHAQDKTNRRKDRSRANRRKNKGKRRKNQREESKVETDKSRTLAPVANKTEREAAEALTFIHKIFKKYGGDNVLYFEGFEHFMESLGLGALAIEDHDIHDHTVGKEFVEFHKTHNHTNETDPRGRGRSQGSEKGRSDEFDGQDNRDVEDEDHHHEEHHEGGASESNHNTHHESQKQDLYTDNSRSRQKRSLSHPHDHDIYDRTCLSPQDILYLYQVDNNNRSITIENFLYICPAMLYQMDEGMCRRPAPKCRMEHQDWTAHCVSYHRNNDGSEHEDDDSHRYHGDDDDSDMSSEEIITFLDIPGKVWGFAVLSVTVISLVGLVCVAVVPIMNRALYSHLVQFLVALAVGTLTGDALLHLIPHALIEHDESAHDGSHGHDEGTGEEREAVWKGMAVLGGAYFFLVMERLMGIMSKNRKKKQLKHSVVQLGSLEMTVRNKENILIGEKLSHPNRNSLYLAYLQHAGNRYSDDESDNDDELHQLHEQTSDAEQCTATGDHDGHSKGHNHGSKRTKHGRRHSSHSKGSQQGAQEESEGHRHESEGHKHGHSHSVPGSVSSIAWMVIMGDGLHNFSDGLAIGAAFANSITVGLSTSIAVFCHELPHELGDFAVLLKAGMSVKHALFYNIVSSVLSFMGMFIGVAVGNISSASAWIFAITAGIFIYISLVDMLPEISLSDITGSRRTCCHLVLQIFGISTGVAIMLVIALFESKIKVG